MTIHSMTARRGQEGFTLVETLIAILIFAVMTMGLVPLLASSLRGTDLSRSYTIGKNVAVEAMERVRGLPFHISFGAQDTKVDVLDLYFPNKTGGPGQTYSAGLFTTTCTSATLANPACPRELPAGTTMTFAARFVTLDGAGVEPADGYTWDSTTGADRPPTQLLDMSITATWTQAGEARNFTLQSLVGDRKFGDVKVRGTANVDYTVQVLTRYVDGTGQRSELLALGGMADSEIETRLLSSAALNVRAAQLRLTQLPTDTNPTATDLDTAEGATSSHQAPPDSSPAGATAGAGVVTHPLILDPLNTDLDEVEGEALLDVAGIDATLTSDLKVAVSNQLPVATGKFSYSPGTSGIDFWVQSQLDQLNNDRRRLDMTQKVFSVRGAQTRGSTTGETGALAAADRRVEMRSEARLEGMRLLPTTFIDDFDARFGGAVVTVDQFVAQVKCLSSDSSVTATAEATWSALLRYWRDTSDDGVPGGAYVDVALGGNLGTDPLNALRASALSSPGSNPLVYDGLLPTDDIYLFEDPALLRAGYIDNWSSLASTGGEESDTGRATTAIIPGAIKIDTTPTNAVLPESGLNIQLGKLSCEAVDDR